MSEQQGGQPTERASWRPLSGDALREALDDGPRGLDAVLGALNLDSSSNRGAWLTEVLAGTRRLDRVEAAQLAAYSEVPLSVIGGLARPLRPTWRASLDATSAAELTPALDRTAAIVRQSRLVLSWGYIGEVKAGDFYHTRRQQLIEACAEGTADGDTAATADQARGYLHSEPFASSHDMADLLESLGVPVSAIELPAGVYGLLATDTEVPGSDARVSIINKDHGPAVRQQTLARQLSHIVFASRQPLVVDRGSARGPDTPDDAQFADCFLGPLPFDPDLWKPAGTAQTWSDDTPPVARPEILSPLLTGTAAILQEGDLFSDNFLA